MEPIIPEKPSEVILEGPDKDNDGKPDWTLRMIISNPWVQLGLAIVIYVAGLITGQII